MKYITLVIALGIVLGIGLWSRRQRLKFKTKPKSPKQRASFSSGSKRSTKLRRVK